MHFPDLDTTRFTPQPGLRIIVQVPAECAQRLLDHVQAETELKYGDYACVSFKTSSGLQQFRSLGTGRNPTTNEVVEVPCIELSFFVEDDPTVVTKVTEALYAAHPYEEPVIFIQACLRTLHIKGRDEDNPNRFWNAPPADWVPEEHR